MLYYLGSAKKKGIANDRIFLKNVWEIKGDLSAVFISRDDVWLW